MLALALPDCNDGIEFDDSTDITLSPLINNIDEEEGEFVIFYGSCVQVDDTDGSIIILFRGLTIHRKLYFPSTSHVILYTSHMFVMGILEIKPLEYPNTIEF